MDKHPDVTFEEHRKAKAEAFVDHLLSFFAFWIIVLVIIGACAL
jgi:hypothetical protein